MHGGGQEGRSHACVEQLTTRIPECVSHAACDHVLVCARLSQGEYIKPEVRAYLDCDLYA